MKLNKLLVFILTVFISTSLNAQKGNYIPKSENAKTIGINRMTELFCNDPAEDPCNKVNNNKFSSTCFGSLPFNNNCVSHWSNSHGSPQLNEGGMQLAPDINHASMRAENDITVGIPTSEGIAVGMTNLIPGNRYTISFFKRYHSATNISNFVPDLDEFNIYLISCEDFFSMNRNSYEIPEIPIGAQQIYCEKHIANTSFERVVQSFTANSNYGVLWIFPKETTMPTATNTGPEAWLDFAMPEIINITNFNAGPTPTPTPGNCMVTIGPSSAPACTVSNVLYSWKPPVGPSIPVSSPNLQIQVDASIPENVGIWTLIMSASGAVTTNNTCSPLVTATVNVPSNCIPWPKEFNTNDGGLGIMKDNKGNIIVSAASINNLEPFYNHVGLPIPQTYTYSTTIQYTNNGVTNWTKQWLLPLFNFKSGIIQTYESNISSNSYNFIDGNSGNSVPPPISTLTNELVLAETNSNIIISIAAGNILKAYTNTGALITSLNIGTTPSIYNFNTSTNNLIFQNPQNLNNIVMLHFNGSNFVPLSNINLPYLGTYSEFVHCDNSDMIYFMDYINNKWILKKFDYRNPSALANLVQIPGFNNSDLEKLIQTGYGTGSLYTEDKFLVYSNTDNYIYCLDFSTNSFTKIITSNYSPFQSYYVIDGDNFYLINNCGVGFTIGNQIIPSYYNMFPNSGNAVPIAIIKLSLQNDFNLKSIGATNLKNVVTSNNFIEVRIHPNPSTSNVLSVQILNKHNMSNLLKYKINIINQFGKILMTKKDYYSNSELQIGNLEKGVYYIEIIDSTGTIITKSFMKL